MRTLGLLHTSHTRTRNKLMRGLLQTSSPDLLVSLPTHNAVAAPAVAATAARGCSRAQRAAEAPPAPTADSIWATTTSKQTFYHPR